MIRPILIAALMACFPSLVLALPGGGIRGTVTSVGSNYFIIDADGTDVKVFADGNTVYRVEDRPGSAAFISKDTEVTVAGTSDRAGVVKALLVRITPSHERVEGTVKDVKNDHFIMLNAKGEQVKVVLSRATTYYSNGRKSSTTRVKNDAKVIVTPVTNHSEMIYAWKVDITDNP